MASKKTISEDTPTRAQIQQTFDVSAAVHETRSGSNVDGYANPYSSAVFPQSDYKLLTVTFYDHYQFPGAPAQVPHDVQGQRVWANAKGLQTGSWVRVLAEPNETVGETTYTLYDYQGRALHTHTQNYLGGHTTVTQVYNFAGQVVNTQTDHQLFNSTNPIKVDENFTYTRQGQLKTRTHQINNQARELIADHHYDALGQLIRKEVGGQDFSTLQGLQSVDYRYNIRGWLTDINNVGTLAQSGRPHDLFAFKINYNQVEDNTTNGVVPLYNGNISETYWRSYNDNVLRNYGYTYDALNRLEEAFYQKPGYTQPNVNNYREKLAYDPNGNITHLWRNGELDATNFALEIDDLTYTYAPDSNLLLKVTDATAHPAGFRDDATDGNLASDPSDDYAYDAMGNMVKDENKTIRSIKYNHLNLPTFIDFGARGTISYFYDATGRKVRKVVQINVLSQNTVTDYANGFQYENNIIQFFPTTEGYASRLTTKFDLLGRLVKIPIEELPEDQFTYVYNYTDHLGNIRLSYAQDPDTQQLKIVEQNHYYPFGLRHTNYSGGKMQVVKEQELKRMAPTPEELLSYKYKFQGQERQDELGLNWDSFKWRNYDYAIGRFMSIDPLAEKYSFQSPYNFAENKVISHVEIEGLEGLHHTYVDKAGNVSHVVEKNVILLRQLPQEVPTNATPKEIKKVNRENERILEEDNKRINEIKSELNAFYGGNYQNSNGENVTFKINYTEILTNDATGNSNIVDNKSLVHLSVENGLISSEKENSGASKIVPAAVFTSDTDIGGGLGLTTGGRKVFANAPNAPSGTYAHEFIHTLGVSDNNYQSGGVLNSPPSNLLPTEIDEIIAKSYAK